MAAAVPHRHHVDETLTLDAAVRSFFPKEANNSSLIDKRVTLLVEDLKKQGFFDPQVLFHSARTIVVKATTAKEDEPIILKISSVYETCSAEKDHLESFNQKIPGFTPRLISKGMVNFGEEDGHIKDKRGYIAMEYAGENLIDAFLEKNNLPTSHQLTSFLAQYLVFWKKQKNENLILGDIKLDNIVVKKNGPNDLSVKFIDVESAREEGPIDLTSENFSLTMNYSPPTYSINTLDLTFVSFPLGTILYGLIANAPLFGIEEDNLAPNFPEYLHERIEIRVYLDMIFQLIGEPPQTFFQDKNIDWDILRQAENLDYHINLEEKEKLLIPDYFVKTPEGLKKDLEEILANKEHPLHVEGDVERSAQALSEIILKLLRADKNMEPEDMLDSLATMFPEIRTQFGHYQQAEEQKHVS